MTRFVPATDIGPRDPSPQHFDFGLERHLLQPGVVNARIDPAATGPWLGIPEALHRRDQEFRALVENAPDIIARFDCKLRHVYVNPAIETATGLPPQAFIGQTNRDLNVPDEINDLWERALRRVFEFCKEEEIEYSYPGPDGDRSFQSRIVPEFSLDGTVETVLAITRDVTEQKRAEQARAQLIQSLEVERSRLAGIFAQAPAIIATLRGPELVFESVNPLYLRHVGNRDVLGKPVREVLPEVAGQGFFELLDQVYRTGEPFVGKEAPIRLQTESGGPLEEQFFNFVYHPLTEADGSVSGILFHGVDVTEPVRARQRQAAVAELGNAALAGSELSALMDLAARRLHELLRVDYTEVLELLPDGSTLLLRAGMGWREGYVGHARVETGENSQLRRSLRTPEPIVVDDLRTETRFAGSPLLHEHGVVSGMKVSISGAERPYGALGVHTRNRRRFTADEIDFVQTVANVLAEAIERRRGEEALRNSEERYHLVMRATSDVIWDLDLITDAGYWSENFGSVFRYAAEEVDPTHDWWKQRVHAEDRDRVLSEIDEFLHGTEEVWTAEYRFQRGDGSYAVVLDRSYVTRNKAGVPVRMIGSMMDITERKAAEQALRRAEEQAQRMAERMKAVAAAASGVIGALSYRALQDVVREACQQVVPLDAFTFSLYDEAAGTLTFLGSYDDHIATPDDETLPLAGTPSQWVVQERRTLLTHTSADLQAGGSKLVGSLRRSESAIRTPILAQEEVLGVLSAQSYTPHLYSEQEVEVMEALAALAATAILNIRQREETARAEEALRESEQHFRALIEEAEELITILDVNGNIRYESPAVQRVAGWSPDETYGRSAFEFVHPEDVERTQQEFMRLLQIPGSISRVELRFRHAEGHWLVLEVVGTNLLHDPAVTGVVINSRDVTERRRAEDALRRSEEQLRLFLQQTPAVLWSTDAQLRFTMGKGAGLNALGFNDDGAADFGLEELFGTTDAEHPAIAAHRRALAGESVSYEMEWLGATFASHAQPFRDAEGVIQGVIGLAVDVTESRRAREAVHESTARLRAIVDTAVDGIITIDEQGTIDSVNPAAERMFGYASAELVGRNVSLLMPEPNRSGHDGYLEQYRRTGMRRIIGGGREVRGRRKDGSEFPLELAVSEMSLPDRRLFTGMVRDITERKQAEERIRFQAHLLDKVGQAVIATDLQGRVLYWNQAAEALYGWPADEALGRDLLELTPTDASKEQAAEIMERLRAGESWAGEFMVRRRDGSSFPAHVTDTPIQDEDGNLIGIVGISSDETPRHHLEAQLRHAQKMEAVGRLAGGVAHDFNNILTAINGSAMFLLSDLEPQHPSRPDVEGIQRAAMRAAALIRQLMAFSRRQVLQPRVLDLNVQLSEMVKMLSRVIGEDIKLVTVFSSIPPLVRVDPVQLEQVVLNLCINARDAMPGVGTLTIEIAHKQLSSEQACGFGFPVSPGSYVQLSVSDTGHGMNEEVLSHLFEPFFTTKEPGRGTGLGLPTVYGIVKQSEGYIDVRSTVGEGTTVDILFPPVPPEPEALSVPEADQEALSGSETILLVEDDEIVRSNTRRVLERSGYTVIEASDGLDALRCFQAHPASIDLLLTDLIMPGLNGRELAERLRQLRPAMRVLCMSGYSDERILPHGAEFVLLEKPFLPVALLGKIREVLHAN